MSEFFLSLIFFMDSEIFKEYDVDEAYFVETFMKLIYLFLRLDLIHIILYVLTVYFNLCLNQNNKA